MSQAPRIDDRIAGNTIEQLEPVPQIVKELIQTGRHLSETADKLRVFEECDLICYYDQIQNIPNPEWYQRIQNAHGHISLMSPSLQNWFTDPPRMRNLLISKAIEGTKIRFIIMGHENTVGRGIASLMRARADVGFYKPEKLKDNEEEIRTQLFQVNEGIQSNGQFDNYVQLKKVVSTPIFVKTEFFGEVLHWSFFGYNLDGKVAPSFWCREKIDDGKSPGLYQILRDEFETIWSNDSISESIDITPNNQEDDD